MVTYQYFKNAASAVLFGYDEMLLNVYFNRHIEKFIKYINYIQGDRLLAYNICGAESVHYVEPE